MKKPVISQCCPKGHEDIDFIDHEPESKGVYQGKRYCFCYTCCKKYYDKDYK